MEEQTKKIIVPANSENFPKARIPSFLIVFLFLLILVLIGEGVYYFYLYPKWEKSRENTGKTSEGLDRYFEGPRFYIKGNLALIEGMIDQINNMEIVISRGGEKYTVLSELVTGVMLMRVTEPQPILTKLSYEDLVVGMHVSFTPSSGQVLVVEE